MYIRSKYIINFKGTKVNVLQLTSLLFAVAADISCTQQLYRSRLDAINFSKLVLKKVKMK